MLKLFESPLIVLGMHRSGTTMFTDILISSGYFMGKDLSSNSESYMFSNINESLLNSEGGSWNRPVEVVESEKIKLNEQRFYFDFLRIRRNPFLPLKIRMFNKWGWKDPRNTFTLEYWIRNYFPKARVLHIYRNGIDVALSLKVRNEKIDPSKSFPEMNDFGFNFRLWERYVEKAFSLRDNSDLPQIHISYEELLRSEENTIKEAELFLGITNLKFHIDKIAFRSAQNGKHQSLNKDEIELVKNSEWMKKLNYL